MSNKSEDTVDDMPIIGNIIILSFSIFFAIQCFKYLSTDEITTVGNDNSKSDLKINDTTILAQKKVDSSLKSFEQYIVNTSKGNLNIRTQADTLSILLGSLKKGSSIFAKPSEIVGWSSYSKDEGATVFGYVFSKYLTKK
jgi:hypothetical protein